MNFIINCIVMISLFVVGVVLFTINSFDREFIMGLTLLMTFFVGVNLYGLITRSLTTKMLSYMMAVAFLFVAASVFGNYAVEQKAIGYTTMYDFSLYGVAISVLLIFISSFFFVLAVNTKISFISQAPKITTSEPKVILGPQKTSPPNIIESEDWEEASLEDIESGEYSF